MLPSMLAWRMADIAIGYLLFELTGSATMLGVMGMALALPVVSFALLGGVAADRIARRTLLSLTQGGLAVIGGLLALVVLTDTVQVWHLFAFAVLQGALFAFNVPARQSFLTELVHKDDLVNAIALRSFGMNASRVAGPALAGLLISFPTIGIGGICVLMAAGYAVVVLIVIGLPYRPPAPTNASARQQAVAGAALRMVYTLPANFGRDRHADPMPGRLPPAVAAGVRAARVRFRTGRPRSAGCRHRHRRRRRQRAHRRVERALAPKARCSSPSARCSAPR